jgi:DNA-binding CsgD family transcriptional regulator
MANKPRSPITEEERQEMRARFSNGESFLEISRAFSCSPRTVEKACTGLRVKKGGHGVPITTKQIEEIARLRAEGMYVPEISRIVGVSITSVTRYSPRDYKRTNSTKGGNASCMRKKEKRAEVVAALAEAAKIAATKAKPKTEEEIPESVLRMTESFRMRGIPPTIARAEALRIYAKTKR